jgi:hypothetical protein
MKITDRKFVKGTELAISIHDISVTDLIRNCELPEDSAVLAPKRVGAAITF